MTTTYTAPLSEASEAASISALPQQVQWLIQDIAARYEAIIADKDSEIEGLEEAESEARGEANSAFDELESVRNDLNAAENEIDDIKQDVGQALANVRASYVPHWDANLFRALDDVAKALAKFGIEEVKP